MGRTPLMRALLRLVADHREATESGMPIEAVREQRARRREGLERGRNPRREGTFLTK